MGPEPESIKLFDELALKRNPDAVILRNDDWREYVGRHRGFEFSPARTYAQRADVIRYMLLCAHGGIWLDADCIVNRSLSPILHELKGSDLLLFEEEYRRDGGLVRIPYDCANYFMAANPHTGPIRSLRNLAIEVCEELGDDRAPHETLSKPLMRRMYKHHGDQVRALPAKSFMPIHWKAGHPKGLWFRSGTDAQHAERYDPQAYTYMLSRGVIHHTRNWSRRRWLSGDELICYIVRRAME